MRKIQTQGVHHITLVGADRQTSIDFWEGVLGMPLIFEQPNLDRAEENHLYFDPGDGRLITIFTNEGRELDPTPNPIDAGNLHHVAFIVSRATFTQVARRLDERGVNHTGEIDRYFRDPLGQEYELACYKFDPPVGVTHAEVLLEAHHIRVAQEAYNITDEHLADAIDALTRRTARSLSADRESKNPW
jgi:catechol 2,3-dioxygenase-like lactoylglutathione lyase family enzyme